MDPKDQPQFNPKIPISEVLKQEQAGFVPSAPKLSDIIGATGGIYANADNSRPAIPAQAGSTTPGGVISADTSKVSIIKTYRSDAADAVKIQQTSVAKIAIAQDEQRRGRGEEIGAEPKKKTGLLFLAIILIVLGAIAVPTVQYILNRKTVEVSVAVEKTIIPFTTQTDIVIDNATRTDLLSALDSLGAKQTTTSNIEYRKIFEKILDANKKTINQKIASDIFAGIIGPNIPSALARSFDSDYMYGIENSANPMPFILFRTSSYQQTFAGMLQWESKMISDLSPVLNLDADTIGRPFSDRVVINKDVRAATAPDGTILFLYGFLDNQTLVITPSVQTFQDINSRYVAAHFVQ